MSTASLPDPRPAAPSRSVKVYFDGGCRPNPGAMEVAAVVRGAAHVLPAIGQGSSFDAEWRALIHAAEVAQSLGLIDFVLLGDAASVVAQANGSAPCRGAALAYREALLALLPPGPRPRVRYIKRAQNLAGIALARLHDR
ncbi:reverse transcriptase-like protein [Sphingomonas sp. AR_OL41]|uniref:reverse transcriptase-like protein n=1 Tax=Sphingomonas sp. AR_OL41 TaxID=3042729 RepID=UPI002480857E|nr:reverse transcriptase-like protein [Sphingomonas sp. AR_OL41]MDH7974290.1 reverse transcriptase-like protein [Sphingomonas sp. AR_OL41]